MHSGLMMRYGRKAIENKKCDEIPDGYIRTPYLHVESATDGIVIGTGTRANVNDEYIITCRRKADGNNRPVFGDGASKTNSNIALWLNDKTNLVEFTFGDGGKNTYKVLTTSYNVCEFHTYRMQCSTGKAWLDGNYIGQSQSKSDVGSPKNLVFFGSWRGTAANGNFPGDVKEFIIIRNGVKIRHFVPVIRKYDWRAGFYDLCESESPEQEVSQYNTSATAGNNGTHFFTPPNSGHKLIEGDPLTPDEESGIQFDVNVDPEYPEVSFSHILLNRVMKIDWGDGSIQTLGTTVYQNNTALTHTYADPGIYTIRIKANISNMLYFKVGSVGTGRTTIVNMRRLDLTDYSSSNSCTFYYCYNMRMGNHAMSGTSPTIIPTDFFKQCRSITPSVLPDTVETIGGNAFQECRRLSKLTMPDSVTSIGNSAFLHCDNLDLDNLPRNIASINQKAFQYCNLSSLTGNVTLENLTAIGEFAFGNTSISWTSLTAPNLTHIGSQAFTICSSLALTSLNAPKLACINTGTFYRCISLSLTSLPSSITFIDSDGFRECRSLALTELPSTITAIYSYAFYECRSLAITSLNLPDLTIISTGAFINCKSMPLTSITAPKLTTLGSQAFHGCSSMTLTSLPDSITTIGVNAFNVCSNIALESLPKGLVTIGSYAFQSCNKITDNLVMPSTLRTMGDRAFNYVNFDTIRFLGKPDSINIGGMTGDIYVPWSEGEVDLSHLNAGNPAIHYDCDVSGYYIQENLVGFYDGIQNTRNGHDPNATVWEDLSSKHHDLTLYLNNCSVESDHLHLNGTGLAAEDPTYRMYADMYTLEVVYARGTAVRGMVACGFNSNYGNSVLYTDSNGNCCISLYNNTTRRMLQLDEGRITHLARNAYMNASFFKDGERIDTADMVISDETFEMTKGKSTKLHIGDVDISDLTSSPANGDIYCIRFYARMLTPAEIIHNYNIDRMRFRMYLQESSSSSSESSN